MSALPVRGIGKSIVHDYWLSVKPVDLSVCVFVCPSVYLFTCLSSVNGFQAVRLVGCRPSGLLIWDSSLAVWLVPSLQVWQRVASTNGWLVGRLAGLVAGMVGVVGGVVFMQ